jgi:putative component of toxin-antitoxin plasmid stabilization module
MYYLELNGNWSLRDWLNKFKNQSAKCKIKEVIQHLMSSSAGFHNF